MIVQSSHSPTAIRPNQCRGDTAACAASHTAWQKRFLELLPKIRRHAQIRFRALAPEAREELVQETIARALMDFLRLVQRGKEHLACATPLARFAVAQVRQGRRVGSRLNGRDVGSEYGRLRNGVLVLSLDSHDETSGSCCEALAEDRRSTPADIAAIRIDFAHWLTTLSPRSRRLAERLAMGETTSGAARLFGISPGRVSQLRGEFRRAWHAFQGEAIPAAVRFASDRE
jgi:DNA-directed RNA polymerase specialized sigma24 family protein